RWIIGTDEQNNECQFEEMRARKYESSPVKFDPSQRAQPAQLDNQQQKPRSSAELAEAYLDTLDNADGEDLTINTRLAMEHIDSMFASPDGKSGGDQRAQPMAGKVLA